MAGLAGGWMAAAHLPRMALAEEKPERIVLANFGGDTAACIDTAFAAPFSAQQGAPCSRTALGLPTASSRR